MRRPKQIKEVSIRMAPEASVRRLARYCGVVGWDTLSLPLLIDELGWKGVVAVDHPEGMY